MNEKHKEREEREADARALADAIDLVHSFRFVAGDHPPAVGKDDVDHEAMVGARVLVTQSQSPLHMRAFQRAGISSRVVARCLRDGVLGVVRETER